MRCVWGGGGEEIGWAWESAQGIGGGGIGGSAGNGGGVWAWVGTVWSARNGGWGGHGSENDGRGWTQAQTERKCMFFFLSLFHPARCIQLYHAIPVSRTCVCVCVCVYVCVLVCM